MATHFTGKVFSRVINDALNTYYSDFRFNGALGAAERLDIEVRTTNVSGTSPTLTLTLETSADGVNWRARSTPITVTSISSGLTLAGQELGSSKVGGRSARLGVKLGGSTPGAYVEVWATAREAVPVIALDLSTGGTFARASAAYYYTQAPTDGSASFLTAATSGTRRSADTRGDGIGGSLLMEKAATNYMLRSRDLSHAAWHVGAGSYTVTANAANGPDGTTVADRLEITNNGVSVGPYQATPGPAGAIMCSMWVRARTGTDKSQCYSLTNGATAAIAAHGLVTTTTYARNEIGGTATTDSGFVPGDGRDLSAVGVTVTGTDFHAHAEDNYIDLVQLEAGCYPTSPIETAGASVTRPADTLSYATGSYPAGFLTSGVVVSFAPDASSAEIIAADEDWRLVQVGASDYLRIRNVSGACKVELVCGSSIIAALTVTFSRGQVLTIRARPSAGSLTVTGATTGDGTNTGTGAAWAAASTLYVGGNSGGTNNVTGRYVGARVRQA